jgi:hypothetical protein
MGMDDERRGGTGPQQPSQAEGDRATVEQDIDRQLGGEGVEPVADDRAGGGRTPAARPPDARPSQAEGERDRAGR